MKTTYAQFDSQLSGRNAQRRKLGNNTYAERRGDSIAIRLHATDILTFHPDGRIVAQTGGWKTLTTKDRLNSYLPVYISQRQGRWFVGSNGKTVEFADGITFHPDGSITGAKPASAADAEKKLQKQIMGYCKALTAALPIPMPGPGDCFYCQMREVKTGKPLGEVTGNCDHLHSHLEESYFVPSLVWNALLHAGCNPQGGGSLYFAAAFQEGAFLTPNIRAQLSRFVKKYLRRQFGL